jgi:Tol biopolymer transport system component
LRQIERLYHAALERDPGSRSAFLLAACADDSELVKEVESLLAQSANTGSLLAAPARRIGDYELRGLLGAGGMGEVYRAHDSRLHREVAIKVLPADFAADPTRVSRFEREARLLASLNHPNIATVHGIEWVGTAPALVMELVDGETLGERIQRTAGLPLHDVVDVARQIAAALDVAHEKGIVHRDIKPANVKIAASGIVKVFDFGLAKTSLGERQSGVQTWVSNPDLTTEGTVVGTVAYMSPEQARGQVVDNRTDIWAFGCVLYEMLTGQKAFAGESVADVVAAIVGRDPDWGRVAHLPDQVRWLLRRCLEKDAGHRLRDIGEARALLESLSASGRGGVQPPSGVTTRRRTGVLGAVIGVLAVGVLGAIWTNSQRLRPAPAEVTRMTVTLPPGQELSAEGGAYPFAVSPDGRLLAYVANVAGRRQLYVRSLDAFESRLLPGTTGAQFPFFSPDGQYIAFFANGKLFWTRIEGGTPLPLCDVPTSVHGGTWGPDGTIVFGGVTGLTQVSVNGGPPAPLRSKDPTLDQRQFQWPQFLPDGKSILASALAPQRDPQKGVVPTVEVFSLATREWRRLAEGLQPQFVPPAYLAFHAARIKEGDIQLVRFDPTTLTIQGPPLSVLSGVFRAADGGAAYFAVSRAGTLIFSPGGFNRTLVSVDTAGHRTPITGDRRGFRFPRLSPNGRFAAVTVDPRSSEIWVYDLMRGTGSRLASGLHSLVPTWTLDSHRLLYTYGGDLYERAADGSSAAELLLPSKVPAYSSGWTPDRDVLFYRDSGQGNHYDLWILAKDGTTRELLASAAREMHGTVSPDGRWIAYESDESQRFEVYIRPFPNVSAGKWPVSTTGGHSPLWSHDGHTLYYMTGDTLMAAAVRAHGDEVALDPPRALFSGPFDTTQFGNYDVFPDDEHFLMVEADPDTLLRGINVVLNWPREVEQRLASK